MIDEFPHIPGVHVNRAYQASGYSPYQAALWEAFTDTYYSRAYGFGHTRMPTPGAQFNQREYEAWITKATAAWARESTRDANTRGLNRGDMPEELWLYLYERLLDARVQFPGPYYNNDD